jgi:hypothetical protein
MNETNKEIEEERIRREIAEYLDRVPQVPENLGTL